MHLALGSASRLELFDDQQCAPKVHALHTIGEAEAEEEDDIVAVLRAEAALKEKEKAKMKRGPSSRSSATPTSAPPPSWRASMTPDGGGNTEFHERLEEVRAMRRGSVETPAVELFTATVLPSKRGSLLASSEHVHARPLGTWVDACPPRKGVDDLIDRLKSFKAKDFKKSAAIAFLEEEPQYAVRFATLDVLVAEGAVSQALAVKLVATANGDKGDGSEHYEKTVVDAGFEAVGKSVEVAGLAGRQLASLELHSDGAALMTVTEGHSSWKYVFSSAADESDEHTLRLTGTCTSDNGAGESVTFELEHRDGDGGWSGRVGAPHSRDGAGRWMAIFAPVLAV